jgi:hypothetical protein
MRNFAVAAHPNTSHGLNQQCASLRRAGPTAHPGVTQHQNAIIAITRLADALGHRRNFECPHRHWFARRVLPWCGGKDY